MLDDVLTARIEAAKAWLLAGGLLRVVDWGVVVPSGPTGTPVGAKRSRVFDLLMRSSNCATGLDRSTLEYRPRPTTRCSTSSTPWRSIDDQLFRFGDPPHVLLDQSD